MILFGIEFVGIGILIYSLSRLYCKNNINNNINNNNYHSLPRYEDIYNTDNEYNNPPPLYDE